MNLPFEPHPPRLGYLTMQTREYHFTCKACQQSGVSESPNATYHQAALCQRVKALRSAARAKRRKR